MIHLAELGRPSVLCRQSTHGQLSNKASHWSDQEANMGKQQVIFFVQGIVSKYMVSVFHQTSSPKSSGVN